MSEVIRSAYRRTWWALFLRGLLAIAIGVFILWRPLESIASFALVIALWALFSGITQIVHAFDLRAVYSRWGLLLVSGLISVGFGIAAIYYYPGLSLTFAVVFVAWWLFITGAVSIYVGFMERRLGTGWGWAVAFGVLSILVGVFAVLAPPVTLAALMGLIAGFAIVSGVLLLIGSFRLRSLKEEVEERVTRAKAA
jgi:uncharacterized membrane protein HdeD (DUF308 family)